MAEKKGGVISPRAGTKLNLCPAGRGTLLVLRICRVRLHQAGELIDPLRFVLRRIRAFRDFLMRNRYLPGTRPLKSMLKTVKDDFLSLCVTQQIISN